ncbi:MFS transporter [Sulfitobacter sp. JBTF-M27]|uniref:MFS transporter n=2 Tax=Sulfitobacter sediminilitoris TaxID=2698830 RepID=A0A6P0CFQ4_9RHOB|nr:MFS transporter [Sulfitobacter sediminilitoris]NEK23925.1 MFS transporter [Sulfitobacter sediminilitoris]
MNVVRAFYLSRKPVAGFFAIGAAWAVYFAQMPVIKANVGASDGAYGAALLFAAFGAFAAMWLAPACRRLAGGMAMPFGIAVLAVGMFWASASTSLLMLTFAMLLASIGSGVIDVLVNARVSEIEEAEGVKLMNLNHALYAFAYGGGALLTAALRSAEVPPVPIFAGLLIVLLALAWWSYDIPPRIDGENDPQAEGLSAKLVIITGLIVLMAFLAEASTEGWSALHIERTLQGSAGQGALGPAVLGLMMGVGRMAGHWLSQRVRDTSLMLSATILSAIGIALAGAAQSVQMALIGFAIGGLGISVVAPLALSLIGRLVPASQRLAAISRASVIGYGAFFFGPPLMGLISEGFGLRTSFIAVAFLLAITAVALIPALARRAH